MSDNNLDCIVVGYNDVDLKMVLDSMGPMKNVSGALRNMAHNTVLFRGRRMNYTTLLNLALTEVMNKHYRLHVMQLPNLGVAYLRSFLERRRFKVDHINFFNEEKGRLAELLKQGARSVAITTTFYVEADPIIEIVRFVRQINSDVIIITGGPHIYNVCNDQDITTQNYYLRMINADIYIHDSQGEDTLSKVIQELRNGANRNLNKIPNLIYHERLKVGGDSGDEPSISCATTSGSFIRTPREPENNSLDENIIDWGMFPSMYYTPTVQMRTARSCAFKCAFCSYPVMAGPLTLTSLDVIEREMRRLKEDGVKYLIFIDDTFNVPLPRYKKILKMMIESKFDFKWVSYFRCSNSDDEAFDLMKESGCVGVFMGIESGDKDMLVRMNKHAALEKYEYGIHQLNSKDIITFASLVVGFPGETRQSIQNTIDFINRCKPSYYRAEVYYHSNHLPIQKQADFYGIRGGGYSWQHNTMDWKEACDLVDLMYKSISGSTILPEYMFDFWSIPYLLGKGVSKQHLLEFTRVSHQLLVSSLGGDGVSEVEAEPIYKALHDVSRDIARDMDIWGSVPTST
jgi:radical SAM PhpK family P-methyltransferase